MQHQRGLPDGQPGPQQLPVHPPEQPLQPEVLLRALGLVDAGARPLLRGPRLQARPPPLCSVLKVENSHHFLHTEYKQ